jgi:hypothetical protein
VLEAAYSQIAGRHGIGVTAARSQPDLALVDAAPDFDGFEVTGACGNPRSA